MNILKSSEGVSQCSLNVNWRDDLYIIFLETSILMLSTNTPKKMPKSVSFYHVENGNLLESTKIAEDFCTLAKHTISSYILPLSKCNITWIWKFEQDE